MTIPATERRTMEGAGLTLTGVASTPWNAEVVLAEVRRLLPDLTVWVGRYTGSFWVLIDQGLREFKDPCDLVACIRASVAPSRPSWPPAMAGRRETWPVAADLHRLHQGGPPKRPEHLARNTSPYPSPFPDPGRWRRFGARCRRLMGLPKGDDR